MTIPRALFLVMLTGAVTAFAEWRVSLPGWNYEFPRDHGTHTDFKTEWWYFTGNLESQDGEDFGYQLTFFRQGIIEPGREIPASNFLQRDMKFAHFAVSDISSKKFHHFQKLARGAFGEAGFESGDHLAWIDQWSCQRIGPHDFRLLASDGDVSVDLTLRSQRDPVIHGKNGVSQKSEGEGRASHYYSLTRMATTGTVQIGKKIRSVSSVPITVDANQGWKNRDAALRLIEWCATQGVVFIEQPMPKEQLDDTAWLRARSPLPLIADENCQRLSDVATLAGAFHGVNIKLMKCTGLREAHRMIILARAVGLKVMLGCMTETSCAISAAAQLSPLVDWADLDGALLIKNDCFRGTTIVDGKLTLSGGPGIGVEKLT